MKISSSVQAQRQKGDSCLDDLQHTVYYMKYLWAVKDVINHIWWKHIQTVFLPLCHTCESLKWNFFCMVAATTAQYCALLPYKGSNQTELGPRSYAKVLCIGQLSYFCSQNPPHFQRQHWRKPVSPTGSVRAKERWESNKLAEDCLGIGQKKQATVNATSLLWRRSVESANCG